MANFETKFIPSSPLVGIHPNPGPMPGKHLPEEKKWRIVFLWKDQKLNPYRIAKKLKIDHNSASHVIELYKETGSVHERKSTGRKRKLSASELQKVARMVKQKKTAPQIAQALDNKVHERTIQRRLKEAGYFYGKIRKIERLTSVHKEKRVEYSEEMKGYDWNRVFFSDEKDFELGKTIGYAWQRPGERIVEEYVRHAPKLHVWGAIGAYGKTDLYFFEENLDSDVYISILKARLKENKITYAPKCPRGFKKKWEFLQDGHKAHTSKKTMKFLLPLLGDRLVGHPAMSPDLNPIEDMWSYLDRKVKEAKVTTIKRLKTVLRKEWKNLPWSEIRKSVDSMDRRLEACVENGGGRIPY